MESRIQNPESRIRMAGERAFMLVELIVALSILGILMAGVAVTLRGVGRFDRLLWSRQQCLAAAQAQIDSLLATGRTMEPNAVSTLWPGLKTDVRVQAGQGQWQGLDLVKVTASVPHGRHVVRVTLSRYGTMPRLTAGEGR
jgi:prepilin-type N-terminal cleavage/methylation domain-containing protein